MYINVLLSEMLLKLFQHIELQQDNVLQQAILNNWAYMLTWVCLKDSVELAKVIPKICKHSSITQSDVPNTSSQMIRQFLCKPSLHPFFHGIETKVIKLKILLGFIIPSFFMTCVCEHIYGIWVKNEPGSLLNILLSISSPSDMVTNTGYNHSGRSTEN